MIFLITLLQQTAIVDYNYSIIEKYYLLRPWSALPYFDVSNNNSAFQNQNPEDVILKSHFLRIYLILEQFSKKKTNYIIKLLM